jgi:hypothetical protein
MRMEEAHEVSLVAGMTPGWYTEVTTKMRMKRISRANTGRRGARMDLINHTGTWLSATTTVLLLKQMYCNETGSLPRNRHYTRAQSMASKPALLHLLHQQCRKPCLNHPCCKTDSMMRTTTTFQACKVCKTTTVNSSSHLRLLACPIIRCSNTHLLFIFSKQILTTQHCGHRIPGCHKRRSSNNGHKHDQGDDSHFTRKLREESFGNQWVQATRYLWACWRVVTLLSHGPHSKQRDT